MSKTSADILNSTINETAKFTGEAMRPIWSTLVAGEFYKQISFYAAGLSGVFLVIWVIRHLSHQKRPNDFKQVYGNIGHMIITFFIMSSLITPQLTGSMLFGFHDFFSKNSSAFIKTLSDINGNPNTAIAKMIAAEQLATAGAAECDTIADPNKKTQCRQNLKQTIADDLKKSEDGGWVDQVGNFFDGIANDAMEGNVGGLIGKGITGGAQAIGAVSPVGSLGSLGSIATGGASGFIGEVALMTLLTPVLLIIGTAFQIILEIGQLVAAEFFPFALMVGLLSRLYLINWIKSFVSWSLISFAYKIIVTSVSFVLLTFDLVNSGLYAVVVGIFAPFLAYQLISGSTLGLMGAVGSVAGSVTGKFAGN